MGEQGRELEMRGYILGVRAMSWGRPPLRGQGPRVTGKRLERIKVGNWVCSVVTYRPRTAQPRP